MKANLILKIFLPGSLKLALVFCVLFASCRKDRNDPSPKAEPLFAEIDDPEVVTTLRFYIWDSVTNISVPGSPFSFKDPDGDGGLPGSFLNGKTDSLISLKANSVYKTKIILLDETKDPVDTISNTVAEDESYEHMFFYNGEPSQILNANGNTILKFGYPNYAVKLNGSDIQIRYVDTDNGAAKGATTLNIGLQTYLSTFSATAKSFPFILTLRHQPESKDGTYGPGETDVEVIFKVKIF